MDTTYPPEYPSVEAHRRALRQKLAAGYRLFARYGFDEGVAGHITARDPEHADRFWVNPWAVSFRQLRASDMLLVDRTGTIVEGEGLLNRAAFAIHSEIHAARPEVVAAAHAHSTHGKAFSALGRPLAMITQDACVFHEDHAVYDDFTGVVLDPEEGKRIAAALGSGKAVILRNHGLLTVGETVEAAVWAFITLDKSCHAQLLAQAAAEPVVMPDDVAAATHETVGSQLSAWFQGQPLFSEIVAAEPDLLD